MAVSFTVYIFHKQQQIFLEALVSVVFMTLLIAKSGGLK